MTQEENFLKITQEALKQVKKHQAIAIEVQCKESIPLYLEELINVISTLEERASNKILSVNYLNQFQSSIHQILQELPTRGYNLSDIITNEGWKNDLKSRIEENSTYIENLYNQIKFSLDFFEKIGYFDNNIVAIGANGSGKTTLSNKFRTLLQNNGIVISAQRILLVPSFDNIPNPAKTASNLKNTQQNVKLNKNDSDYRSLQEEFKIILQNLLADNITAGNSYRKEAIDFHNKGENIPLPKITNLDITLQIWNSLIDHRSIGCDDGINIVSKSKENSYPAIQMSDGEKVMLYLIAQVLQAPKSGFIIIDEPEMYLHKTILKKLWNRLESERSDCIFIYLTHDLDFASSRNTAKKIWIKSFSYPGSWEIESIPNNEIPETLMLELLGSRKNILFCEGEKGGIDDSIYSILFPNLTIIPVGSCTDVINHTKAFNRLTNVNTKALGLIDSDYHEQIRLEKLAEEDIHSFQVSEVENLFLDERFLKILADQVLVNRDRVDLIKSDIIEELNKSKESQASKFVSTKIDNYFSDSNISTGNSLAQLEANYQTFINNISINTLYEQRLSELNKIVSESDYCKTLSVFNNKGLKRFVQQHLRIQDFTEKSIKLLQNNESAKSVLSEYFPQALVLAGKNSEIN